MCEDEEMQEHKLTLPTADGKTIYGVRTGDTTKPAVVVVHGLTGHMYEHQFKRAAELWQTDFCVYRFALYGGEEDARNLIDCTLQTHADDFAVVVADVATRHRKVFAVGHSYGGPTIMLANPSGLTAVSLWDPSYDLTWAEEAFLQPFPSLPNVYAMQWGVTSLIGQAMREHALQLDTLACRALAEAASFPIQVIMAGDGEYIQQGESYDSHCPYPHRRDVVAGTMHCFYEHDTATEVAHLTANWFNQWI